MGKPKALLEVDGLPLLLRTLAVLRQVSVLRDVVVIGDGPVPALPSEVRILQDTVPDAGPCGGILAAIRHDRSASWLIVACDHPLLSARGIRWLIEQRRPGAIAVIPLRHAASSPTFESGHIGGAARVARAEPLFAVYEPEAHDVLESLIREGGASPRRLAQREGVWTPEIPEDLADSWLSVNTPAEFEAARCRRASGQD